VAGRKPTWIDELTPEERRAFEDTPIVEDLAEEEVEVVMPGRPKGPGREPSTN
jgi:hypothetical protein